MNSNDDAIAIAFAREALREQRLARRWNTFFKVLFFLYLILILLVSMPKLSLGSIFADERISALVDVQGIISGDSPASADAVVSGLRAAFEDSKTAGVILRLNSPGGSPVQSAYINDEIHRLKEKHPNIPVYAVIQDLGASGAYYVAVAADEIYANESSLIGSIGVRMGGFGFVESMQKLGVERRLLTAGENKGFLDPFTPLASDDVKHVKTLLADIHEQFIATVQKGRKDRIRKDSDLFSGYVWTGRQSLELGLIDGLGSASYVAREIIGAEDIVNFTPREDILDAFARKVGASISESLIERSLQLF